MTLIAFEIGLVSRRGPAQILELMKTTLSAFSAWITASGLLLCIASCASDMSAAECTGIDWRALGLSDGAVGAGPKSFNERAEDCAKRGVAPDVAGYQAGRDEGLQTYCTPKGGYAAGRSGAKYEGVCPTDAEIAFLERFALGARLNDLVLASEKAIDDYDASAADLDQHRYLLGVAEKRYLKPSIGNADRENERQEADHRQREIARLEADLPKMLAAIEQSKAALNAYRAELTAMGLKAD